MYGMIEEMHHAIFLACLIEIFFKLIAVVCLYSNGVERGNCNEFSQEVAAIA